MFPTRASMPRLLRRRLRCFYCSKDCRNDQAGIPRSWLCPHCEAMNHLDERGDITDPPLAAATAPTPQVQYTRPVPPAPVMAPIPESLFCADCQRNQMIVNKAMAEYLPDEDDPEYENYAATADEYRAELESRYPQVCENCIGAVRDQIRTAGYTARTDHLRRILDYSKKAKLQLYTPTQFWTLRIITFAKWTYIFSILVGVIWHSLAIWTASASLETGVGLKQFWQVCYKQFQLHKSVNFQCFNTPQLLRLVWWALVADLVTIWWNPKLEQMTNRPGGRMLGLISLWPVRAFVLGLRVASYLYRQDIPVDAEARQFFHTEHKVMLAFLLVSVFTSWRMIRIEYQSTASFMQPIDPYLPNAPARRSPSTPTSSYKPARPKATTFDTMAQSFTSSFKRLGDSQELDYPPSPTLTDSSTKSQDSDTFSPYVPYGTKQPEPEEMDWTPTQRRFGKQPIPIQPQIFGKTQQPHPQSQPKQPHSIFAKPDPNPFRHKVPAFPKGPIQQKHDPWKPGLWAPALPENKKSFFSEMMKQGGDEEARERLQTDAVPRTVKRDAELFKGPQFKYDHYGYTGEKTTGLEDSFNELFSK